MKWGVRGSFWSDFLLPIFLRAWPIVEWPVKTRCRTRSGTHILIFRFFNLSNIMTNRPDPNTSNQAASMPNRQATSLSSPNRSHPATSLETWATLVEGGLLAKYPEATLLMESTMERTTGRLVNSQSAFFCRLYLDYMLAVGSDDHCCKGSLFIP